MLPQQVASFLLIFFLWNSWIREQISCTIINIKVLEKTVSYYQACVVKFKLYVTNLWAWSDGTVWWTIWSLILPISYLVTHHKYMALNYKLQVVAMIVNYSCPRSFCPFSSLIIIDTRRRIVIINFLLDREMKKNDCDWLFHCLRMESLRFSYRGFTPMLFHFPFLW